MHEIIISPGTDAKDWASIEKRLDSVISFTKTLHIDVIDGKFAPNLTFLDPEPFRKYTNDCLLEVHLMVEEPITYLDAWAKIGCRRFIGQIEKMSDQVAFVTKAQLLGEVGLAIDGKTPLDSLKVPLIDLDTILIMTIQAGFSGQKMIEETLVKVRELAVKNEIPISVDGGINKDTIIQALEAGASRFVTTSAIFSAEDTKVAFDTLNGLVGN